MKPARQTSREIPSRVTEDRLRFEELEAYRGIAALLVVVFHAYQHTREGSGRYVYEGTPLHPFFLSLDVTVPWFFMLSGFLIFLPFARAAIKRGTPRSARGFLICRAIRIIPLYYVAILSDESCATTTTRGSGGTCCSI